MIFRPGCRGVRGGEDTGVCGAGVRCNGLIGRGCGPAVGQWDDQDGKAAAGSVKDCGVRQGCTMPGWGFLRLVGWQLSGGPVCPAG
jgi:hypothetical protein